jgi:hypothetical protein
MRWHMPFQPKAVCPLAHPPSRSDLCLKGLCLILIF